MKKLNNLTDELLKSFFEQFKNENTVVIDVREPDEYAREHIQGSVNVPVSELASKDFSGIKNKTAIFHCRSGNRTQLAKDKLLATGFDDIYCLQGGIEQWKCCGLPVVSNKSAPLELMRQVQITVGSMILLSLLLAYLVSPYFIVFTGVAGIGMLVAGLTGFCGMAKCLMCMPWNKQCK